MAESVAVERRGFTQVITINRPEVKNALDGAAARALAAAADELDADNDLRVGVLTGAGGTFCAGMDLKAYLRGDKPSIEGRGFGGITMTPPRKPLIAAVEGWALAGGFELMLACDLVVAGESSKFGVPEVKRALVPAGGGALLLPGRVPFAVAMELLLTGEAITAGRAAELGLVNRLVPDGAAARALAAAADELDADDGLRVGVLTGAGGTFCAGMDLKAWMRGDKPMIAGRGFGGITITPPRKPLIAAVEGYALAGGFELMLACDLVVAANGSKFGVPEVKRALVAGGGAALLLPRRIPFAAAMELLLTGEQITAARAAELGLVNRLVPDGTALDGALALAELVAANGPLAVAVTKQIARAQADWTAEEGWQRQEELFKPVFESADAREGATAFAEKRAPVWRGV